MPLGNKTPDIHQCAEMLVRIYRAAGCSELMKVLHGPADKRIMKTNTWKLALQRKADTRNKGGWDRYVLKWCVEKTSQACKVLAAERGESIQVQYTPHSKSSELVRQDEVARANVTKRKRR